MVSFFENEADYLNQRDILMREDRSFRRDYPTLQTCSELEREADDIIRKIRKEEATTLWKEKGKDIPHPFPGMEFLTGKKIIEKSRLFRILSKMPKGALLHAHIAATIDAKVLLDLALKEPAIHVRAAEPLTAQNLGSNLPQFSPLPAESCNLDGPSLTSNEYIPGTWVGIARARELFSPSLCGPEGFDKWVVDAMTINPSEAYDTHNTVSKIWKKFQSTFQVSAGLIRFLPIFKQYIRLFFLSSVDDGIFYMEPRFDFFVAQTIYGDDGKQNITHREIVLVFQETMREVQKELEKQGRGNEFIGAKIIYSTLKFVAPEDMDWYLEDCLALKKEFPHLFAGFDLVGNENELRPIADYIKPLLHFCQRQVEEGVEIPFVLHAGETLGDGNAADSNVYDAILLGSTRIGHGFSLVKHPRLIQICRERGIALEICPVSNEILRLTSSMPTHPLPVLLNSGVPIVLGSDDPSVFGNMGLTYDFFQVLVASEVTGLSMLGVLARDSIEFSMMNPEEKRRALIIWEGQWKKFLEFIVAECNS